jgi:HEAT repeat protein
MMRPLLLVALLLPSLAAAAPSDPELDRFFSGYERVITAEEVQALGPDADQAIIRYDGSSRFSRLRRMRAVAALVHLPGERARLFLLDYVAERRDARSGPEVVELSAAVGALAPYPSALATLLPYLEHASPDVRTAAAAALARIPDVRARNAIVARRFSERDPAVRAALGRALTAP